MLPYPVAFVSRAHRPADHRHRPGGSNYKERPHGGRRPGPDNDHVKCLGHHGDTSDLRRGPFILLSVISVVATTLISESRHSGCTGFVGGVCLE